MESNYSDIIKCYELTTLGHLIIQAFFQGKDTSSNSIKNVDQKFIAGASTDQGGMVGCCSQRYYWGCGPDTEASGCKGR